MTSRFVSVLGAAAIAAAFASAATAGSGGSWKAFRDPTVQDFGHQWSKVGDPHNDPFVYDPPSPFVPPRNVGRTNYKYRIMTREVTVGEWFEFVEAYAPYMNPNAAGSNQLLGGNLLIRFDGFSNGIPQYTLNEANANLPMIAGWRFAARFANWMHNDQADAASAFEAGVYDTSTFGQVPGPGGVGNVYTDQQERSEGARFWIPSTDEWKKAGHWDPNRYGYGEGGWWEYPITSDAAPVSGEPGLGGQTNAGTFPPGQTPPLDVGSYPDVQSPWGLLDVSGGAHEWMEEFVDPERPTARYADGTSIYFPSIPAQHDILALFGSLSPIQTAGVRLASIIPSPSPFLVVGGFAAFLLRRHRNASGPERRVAWI